MLIYLGTGERRYGDNPLALQSRRAWEFQAVLKGKIGLSLPDGVQPMRAHSLWISPPGHAHGWVGEKGGRAEGTFARVQLWKKYIGDPKGFDELFKTWRKM
jgi:hypothetical protein